MRSEVEGAGSDEKTSEDGRRAGIIYVDEDGKARQKTFELVECGARSRLLKNNILASLYGLSATGFTLAEATIVWSL